MKIEYNNPCCYVHKRCHKCESNNIEIFGANLSWSVDKQQWHIVNEEDTMYQCHSCDTQDEFATLDSCDCMTDDSYLDDV